MLLHLANGGAARISENRRIAWHFPETYISSFYGTRASYECSLLQHSYVKMDEKGFVEYTDVSDELNPVELTKHKSEPDYIKKAVNGAWGGGEAPIRASRGSGPDMPARISTWWTISARRTRRDGFPRRTRGRPRNTICRVWSPIKAPWKAGS